MLPDLPIALAVLLDPELTRRADFLANLRLAGLVEAEPAPTDDEAEPDDD